MRFLDDIAPMLAISANERVKQTPVRMLLAGLIGWILYSSGMNALLPACTTGRGPNGRWAAHRVQARTRRSRVSKSCSGGVT